MAYCETTDVAEEFKSIKFDSPNAIKTTQVERFIEEADALINVTLGSKYLIPITGTNALILMRQISLSLVAQRIKDILQVKTADDSKQDTRPDFNKFDPMKMLKALASGSITLTDAVLSSSTDGIKSFNVDNGEEHTFLKNTDQW